MSKIALLKFLVREVNATGLMDRWMSKWGRGYKWPRALGLNCHSTLRSRREEAGDWQVELTWFTLPRPSLSGSPSPWSSCSWAGPWLAALCPAQRKHQNCNLMPSFVKLRWTFDIFCSRSLGPESRDHRREGEDSNEFVFYNLWRKVKRSQASIPSKDDLWLKAKKDRTATTQVVGRNLENVGSGTQQSRSKAWLFKKR